MRNRALKNYTGQRFGKLVAVKLIERGPKPENNHKWQFQCDCGRVAVLRIKNVRAKTRSCGCLQRASVVARNSTHGKSSEFRREYRTWKDMRARCRNPNNSDYTNYGGRGISICERWDDFALFVADMGPRPDRHTLDRIDVNGNYEPGNCRWAPDKVQANNKRTNRLITLNGETRTLQSWCDQFGIEPSKVRYRLRAGYSPVEAFSREDRRIDRRQSRD